MIETVLRNGYIFQVDFEMPWYRFKGKGKRAETPQTPAPAARVETRVEVDIAQESLKKRAKQSRGRQGQIFAGGLKRKVGGPVETLG